MDDHRRTSPDHTSADTTRSIDPTPAAPGRSAAATPAESTRLRHALAAAATLLLFVAIVILQLTGGGPGDASDGVSAAVASTSPTLASTSDPAHPASTAPTTSTMTELEPVTPTHAAPVATGPPVPTIEPLPLPDDRDGAKEESEVDIGPVAPPPVAPPVDTLPPTPPPTPAPELTAQAEYHLDPGVHDLAVHLHNDGDLPLEYEIANDGDGFLVDAPVGEIDANGSVALWVDLDVTADGDGPTPFERVIDVHSDGGDAQISIVGQFEKPGYVIAEYANLPIVDYRAIVDFTNVGGLPVEIVGLEAPGLSTAPTPGTIAAGETLELEVAICADGADLPTQYAIPGDPQLPQRYLIGSAVTLETQASPDTEPVVARTDLLGVTEEFEPLDCSPVVTPPTLDLTFELF